MAAAKVVALQSLLARHPAALKLMIARRENVICRHRETKRIRKVQIRALYENNPRFWERQSTWDYYIDATIADEVDAQIRALVEKHRASMRDGEAAGDGTPIGATEPPDAPANDAEPVEDLEPVDDAGTPERPEAVDAPMPPNFGARARELSQMDVDDRIEQIRERTGRLDALAAAGSDASAAEVAEALVSTTEDATLANRSTLIEALKMGNEQAKAYTQAIAQETKQMVKSTIRLVDSDVFNDELVRSVVEKSNGTVVQHMTRVFLMGTEFLLYYNRQVLSRGIATRIRTRFVSRYKEFYRPMLAHIHEDYVTLEKVFLGGMKALTEEELHVFATGFLVHDVGKADDIEYHEGEAAYDRATVERHVKIGYKAVMEKSAYPREAALITGYHHEYYGDPAGYGYFREFLDAYRRAKPSAKADFIMSYTMEPLIDFEVIAYFPAKVLEIIDVFDSVTDPNRRYRSPLSPAGAIEMIREQFIAEHHKVDPILFDLFVEFLRERGTLPE